MTTLPRRTLLRAAALSPLLGLAPVLPARADGRPFRIYMALWRGETVVEQGFRDFLAAVNMPVEIIVRDANQDSAALASFVQEIKATKPDLVYTFATQGVLGICGTLDKHDPARHVSETPVVFVNVGDPVGSNIVTSLTGHGRNLTGVMHLAPISVQFESMQAYRPLRRLAVFYNPRESYGRAALESLKELAAKAGVDLLVDAPLNADGQADADQIEPALERLAAGQPDFLFIPSTSFFIPLSQRITEKVLALGMPSFSGNEALIRDGKAMMGVVGSFYEVGRFAGLKAREILVGGKPAADVPIESLSRFSLLINIQVALQLQAYPPLQVIKYAQFL